MYNWSTGGFLLDVAKRFKLQFIQPQESGGKMKFFWVLTVWLCLIPFLPEVSAEYYQFIDKTGIKHFTDNISEIPEDQRSGLGIHQSIRSPEKIEPNRQEPENTKPVITPESLMNKKKELDREYEILVKKTELLTEQKKTIGVEKYNELVMQLNSEIQEHQGKKDAYEMLVEQYTEQINKPPEN